MNFLRNMSIRVRLILAFSLMALITVFVGALGYLGTQKLANLERDMYSGQLLTVKDLSNANMEAIYMNRSLYDFVIESEKSGMDKIKGDIDGHFKKYGEYMAKYKSTTMEPQEKTGLDKVDAAWPAYMAAADQVMKLSYENKNQEAMRVMNAEASKAFQVLDDALSALVEINAVIAKEANQTSEEVAVAVGRTAMGAILAALLATVVLAWVITNSIVRPLDFGMRVAKLVAAGDLTTRIDTTARDEVASMLRALGKINEGLGLVVSRVRKGSESVASASAEIAHGNHDLSNRTEEQASALHEISSSMDQLRTTVKQTADSAQRANELASTASVVAEKGGAVVGEVVETMRGINEASRKISDIISVIDGIAFQTNILALNAAVEAARAGEQGRGFAVVASEVRSLAGRSADAAKEIKTLINNSVERVERGSVLVDKAGETMTEVVTSIKRVTDLMGEINSSSNEQAAGVNEISASVGLMDQTTQQNAAMVEEIAAAATTLKGQAQDLVQAVSTFKLNGEPGLAPPRALAAAPAKALGSSAQHAAHAPEKPAQLSSAKPAAPRPSGLPPATPSRLAAQAPAAKAAATKAPAPKPAAAPVKQLALSKPAPAAKGKGAVSEDDWETF